MGVSQNCGTQKPQHSPLKIAKIIGFFPYFALLMVSTQSYAGTITAQSCKSSGCFFGFE